VIDAAIAQQPVESAGPLWEHKASSVLSTGDLDRTSEIVKAASGPYSWKASMLAMIAFCKREHAEAARLLDDMGGKKNYPDCILEGRVRQRLGDSEKSRIAFEEAKKKLDYNLRTRPDDCILLGSLAITYASLGKKEDAIATARRATLLFPRSEDSIDGANAISALAEVYTITGEKDAALAELGTIVQVPGGMTWGDLSFNPVWDSLRSDTRFAELLAQARKPLIFD